MHPPKGQPQGPGGKSNAPKPRAKDFEKDLFIPDWARPERIVGYTFQGDLTVRSVDEILKRLAEEKTGLVSVGEKPSVYYKSGHATLLHPVLENVGWTRSERWKWLFFGNVPRQELTNLKNQLHGGAITFAERMRDSYGGFCQGDGMVTFWDQWAFQKNSQTPPDAQLLEIWVRQDCDAWPKSGRGGAIDSMVGLHPSRNRFRWVDDSSLQASLHTLALEALAAFSPRS